jgi:DNA-binding NarL/FixJ family response regulator
MIQILLVDDDPSIRQGLKMRLGLAPNLRVVGEAGDGKMALKLISALDPDVVVMDVELPDQDGIAFTELLRAQNCRAAIIILSMHDDAATRERARAAGAAKFISKHEGTTALLQAIREATTHMNAEASSPMRGFYERYYAAVETSHAHAKFCEYAYGMNLGQHGFATMEQLAKLNEVTRLNAQTSALDLGCGNGMIAEYLSDATSAHITGLDYISSALARAHERTQAKRNRLEFVVGDLTRPDLPTHFFDVVLSLDTIYFSDDYAETIRRWRVFVRLGGQIAIFYSHGANPQNPKETFQRETLPPDQTPLAAALKKCGLEFQTWDFTQQDYELAQRKKEILEKLKAEFLTEGNQFLYDNRIDETLGVLDAIESGMHARYLYRVQV